MTEFIRIKTSTNLVIHQVSEIKYIAYTSSLPPHNTNCVFENAIRIIYKDPKCVEHHIRTDTKEETFEIIDDIYSQLNR
jgi:hypothetical protein